jgi:hypothetical protein
MRTSLATASILLGLTAAVACHKDEPAPQKEAPSAKPAAPATSGEKAAGGGGEKTAAGDKAAADGGGPNPSNGGGGKDSHPRGRMAHVPFGQRPPKPEKPAVPHIPELPDLAKQEVTTPPKLPAGEYACGSAHSGETEFPLMCLEEKNHEHDTKVARVLVPYKEMKTKLAPLPKIVDHREEKTEADVRSQGKAGTCTAFGTSAAIDHSVSRWSGMPSHVSTMELWGRYHQTDIADALIASVGQTFASEEAWPYDAALAWSWRDCPKTPAKGDGPCGKPVDKAKLAELAKKAAVVVEQVEWLPKDMELIRQKVAGGEDPIIGLKLPRHFKPVGKVGSRYIPDYKEESGGHALAISGYALGEKGDNYYLLHNSWGEKWGDGGYAWIHEATLHKHMINGFGILDARPVSGEKAHRDGKTCPAGHAPDSLTGACEPECKEGGPTHNGVCPEMSDCPKDYVNLWGECIGAAPSDSGKAELKIEHEKGEISWKCGPGGCVYTLPKAVGKCSGEPCLLSCPAPSFRAAKDEHGLTCVE